MISAIITTHNRIKLLRRAVNSVLSQSYTDLELIIVDDNSTDDTRLYCEQLEKDNKARYIHIPPEESCGGNYARNKGINSARGEYVAFLDDDDVWHKDKIEKQVNYIVANPEIVAVSSDLIYVYVFNNEEYTLKSNLTINEKRYDFLVSSWMNVTSTMLIKKSVLLELGGFDENIKAIQEIELSYRICSKYKVGVIKEPLVDYYQYTNDPNQITNSIDKYKEALSYIKEKFYMYYRQLDAEQVYRLNYNEKMNIAYRYLRINKMEDYRITSAEVKDRWGKKQRLEYILSFFFNFKNIIKIESFLTRIIG